MKAFDPKGEYTPEEVKAALAGVNGTRPLSFRYSLLSSNGNVRGNIVDVQSCTIENNSLADIKRTAKFDILDVGYLDYLKDRIKPYIRIDMPKDETYASIMGSLDPEAWWKFDDRTVAPAPSVTVTRATGLTYATQDVADLVDLSVDNARTASVQMTSGTLRPEYWSYINTVPTQAVQIQMKNSGTVNLVWELYTGPTLTDATTLVRSTVMSAGADITYSYPVPLEGVYVSRVVATTTTSCASTMTYFKSARLEDSSGKGRYAVGSGLTLGATKVVADKGSAMSTTGGAQRSLVTTDPNIYLKGGLSLNYWISYTGTGNEIITTLGAQSGEFSLSLNDNGSLGNYKAVLTFTSYDTAAYASYTSTINIPATAMSTAGKMVTVSIDPTGRGTRLFINGNVVGSFSDASLYSTILATEYISYTYQSNKSTSTLYFDDFSIHSKGIPSSIVAQLYKKGLVTSVERSGYVEWPQGVFILSSPTRTMVDGNYVHRDVEGYDQLVILKEDSFDYRYSVASGAKYTDSVRRVLQTTAPRDSYPFYSQNWTYYGGATAPTSDSLVITPTVSDLDEGYKSNPDLVLDALEVSAKVTIPTVGGGTWTSFTLAFINDSSSTPYMSMVGIDNSTLNIRIAGTWVKTVTYNATTMAYWRVREDLGTLYWEYSANGTSWTLLWSSVPPFSTDATVRIAFTANHTVPGTVGTTMSKVVVKATSALQTSITRSNTTLPAAMDWEVGTPKLQIINDMLAAINYDSATYDEDGVFVAKPYVSPDKRTAQFAYATDESSVIKGNVDQTVDIFKIPNKWVCVVSDPDRPALVGTYTNTSPNSPTSTVSRGRTIVDYRSEQNAADQVTLDATAARLAFEASQVYEVIDFETMIMPIHQNADVYTLDIDGLLINDKYAEHKWSMDLSVGGSMKHTVRKVVSL